jgi:hypothetical protein
MFNFFKKRREEQVAKNAEGEAMSKLMREADAGQANPLELALAIHDKEKNKESFARILMVLPGADIYTLNVSEERHSDMAVLSSEEGHFLALFTSRELAQAGARPPYDSVQAVSAMELAFGSEGSGWVFNPGTPLVTGVLTEPMLEAARNVLESFELREGGFYTLWTSGAFRAVRILKTDDVGVHFRLYSGGWPERPLSLHPDQLDITDEEPRGIGHLPYTRRSFLAMGPKLASDDQPPVTEDDLEGYRIWEEDKGGYFGR